LGTLGLWVLELFAMYATDRQSSDRRTDKSNAYCPLPHGRGIIVDVIVHVSGMCTLSNFIAKDLLLIDSCTCAVIVPLYDSEL